MAKRPIIKNNQTAAKRNQNKRPAVVNSRKAGGIKKRFNNSKSGAKPNKLQGESGRRPPMRPRQQQQQQQPKMQDARQKLIQKKRSTVVDARDVLAKMAKTQDARSKLNKLRQTRGGGGVALQGGANIKPIGSNILRKTDRNGKISLVTNKSGGSANSGMNLAIQKELGLVAGQPKKVIAKRNASPRGPTGMRQAVVNQLMNEIGYDAYGPRGTGSGYDASVYKWPKPARPTASQLIGSLVGRARSAPKPEMGGWHNIAVNRSAMGRMSHHQYVDLDAVDDEDMPMVPMKQTISLQGSSRISNIHSRLDRIQLEPETHGILAQTKTKVVVPAGHRIVVSNLQSTVTQDDVKELFEDIGQLLAARLVRPGVAEVIYKNLKDAQKAVDTYHNRQLDGQPMKCLLVNKRPLNNPTAPPLSKLESQGILKAINVSSSNTSAKLVPDLSTIHKVLFQRK